MATIRDVAKQAGVSVSTVSIVINGKAEERSISAATVRRVHEAMDELGYHPNISARRLRLRGDATSLVAFFWPHDFRVSILASFLNGFATETRRTGFDCEFLVQLYNNGELDRFSKTLTNGNYSALVIGGMSRKDAEHLEGLDLKMPVVLVNRHSQRYSSVFVDNESIGRAAAKELGDRGVTEVAVITSGEDYLAGSLRVQSFVRACSDLSIATDGRFLLHADSTMEGGYGAANRLLSLGRWPRTVFIDSDDMAVGAIRAFAEGGLSLPHDLGILAMDMTGSGIARYSRPSLTTVEMPNDEVSRSVVSLLRDQVGHVSPEAVSLQVQPRIVRRESL